MKKAASVLGYILFLLIAVIVITEATTSVFLKSYLRIRHHDERSLSYEFDPELGWFPKRSSTYKLYGSVPFEATHNSDGFRDTEFLPDDKPRLAFIGDSFVWGYDVSRDQRFTDLLANKHPDVTVLNMGVSGYGTDQSFLILKIFFDKYDPGYVIYINSPNDRRDNSSNIAYGYNKPYFEMTTADVVLKGAPVKKNLLYQTRQLPKGIRDLVFIRLLAKTYDKMTSDKLTLEDPTPGILKEINSFLKDRGAKFAVGFVEKDPELMQVCRDNNIPFIDLTAGKDSYRYPGYGNHWTPEGHIFVTGKIEDFLKKMNWLN